MYLTENEMQLSTSTNFLALEPIFIICTSYAVSTSIAFRPEQKNAFPCVDLLHVTCDYGSHYIWPS